MMTMMTANRFGLFSVGLVVLAGLLTRCSDALVDPEAQKITAASVNRAPVAANDSTTVKSDSLVVLNVLLNDVDVDGRLDPQTIEVTPPGNGTAVANADSTITYTPRQGYVGADRFSYTVKDDLGAVSDSATVRVTVILARPKAPVLSTPADEADDQPTELGFAWQAVQEADLYQIQVAADLAFTNPVFDSGFRSGTRATVSGLMSGTLYYWRVRASNAAGLSPWSAVWQFRTLPAVPGIPVPQSPPNGSAGQPLTPTLAWSAVEGASGYQIQIASNVAFAGPVYDETVAATSQRIPEATLAEGTLYFWRVRARNTGGVGGWSVTWTFTTAAELPGVPTLDAPADGALDQPLTPTLSWNAVLGVNAYEVEVATDVDFAEAVFERTVSTPSVTLPAGSLMNETVYYWRVRASDEGTVGPWSVAWRFTTLGPPPEAPLLVAPADGAVDQPLTVNLSWTAVEGAETYQVEVTPEDSLTPVFDETVVATALALPEGALVNGTVYRWRVRAQNAGGASPWTDAWTFETLPLGAPTLVSPADGAVDQPQAVDLTWAAVNRAAEYQVHVATDEAFADLVFDRQTDTPAVTVPEDTLEGETLYFWRVRVSNPGRFGDWSEAWSFTTAPEVPPAPSMPQPGNNATGVALTPVLSWSAVDRADEYQVVVATDSLFADLVHDVVTLEPTSTVAEGVLTENTRYFWGVKGRNEGGDGPWSPIWRFTTQ